MKIIKRPSDYPRSWLRMDEITGQENIKAAFEEIAVDRGWENDPVILEKYPPFKKTPAKAVCEIYFS